MKFKIDSHSKTTIKDISKKSETIFRDNVKENICFLLFCLTQFNYNPFLEKFDDPNEFSCHQMSYLAYTFENIGP